MLHEVYIKCGFTGVWDYKSTGMDLATVMQENYPWLAHPEDVCGLHSALPVRGPPHGE
jgi:hypothetical protein